MNSSGQGTIEYLVVIAVVVVISLVVVGLVVGQTENASAISSTSNQIAMRTAGISVGDSIADSEGNLLLVLGNNLGENLTINKIVVDGVEHTFDEELGEGRKKSFLLSDVVDCTGNKKDYSMSIKYTSSYGLDKTLNYGTVTINCAAQVNPKGTVITEEGIPPDEDNEEVINGICGSAAKTYLFDESFPDGNYCLTGTENETPSDPAEGETISWNCVGSGTGHTDDNCTATRETFIELTVIYNGNGNTLGTVPIDSNTYANGATVTVLGNTGSMSRSWFTFNGWNTQADGLGTARSVSSTFTMGAENVTLYAQWTPMIPMFNGIPVYTTTGCLGSSTATNVTSSFGFFFDTTSNNLLDGLGFASQAAWGNGTSYTVKLWNYINGGSNPSDYTEIASAVFTHGTSYEFLDNYFWQSLDPIPLLDTYTNDPTNQIGYVIAVIGDFSASPGNIQYESGTANGYATIFGNGYFNPNMSCLGAPDILVGGNGFNDATDPNGYFEVPIYNGGIVGVGAGSRPTPPAGGPTPPSLPIYPIPPRPESSGAY